MDTVAPDQPKTRKLTTIMLSWLPAPLLMILSVTLTVLNTAINSILIVACSLLKLCVPIPAFRRLMSHGANIFMRMWLHGNAAVLRLANRVQWEIQDNSQLNPDGWHLIICNHLSWTDIVILGDLFRQRLPVPKFLVHRVFPGKAALIFRKKYSESRNP